MIIITGVDKSNIELLNDYFTTANIIVAMEYDQQLQAYTIELNHSTVITAYHDHVDIILNNKTFILGRMDYNNITVV